MKNFFRYNVVIALLTLAALFQLAAAQQSPSNAVNQEGLEYRFDITVDFRTMTQADGADNCLPVTVEVSQSAHLLKQLSWPIDKHYSQFKADGVLEQTNGKWHWEVPELGGKLVYCVQLNHSRGERYDSRVTTDWALFRADDLVPAANSRVRRDSRSRTQLQFLLPPSWSSVTRYPEISEHHYAIDNPDRLFDRPTGWVQLGKLGVRRNRIADTNVAVSAPVGQEVRRLEILTMLGFTVPTVREWFPDFPDRLLVVSATDNMWRGALSGPGSLFLHGDRPLVSENGTSTLLHELVHVAMQREATRDADWIDEGLAEYLALVLLNQSGGITDHRFKTALEEQQRWGDTVKKLASKNSKGAATAKAVTVFANLHNELGDGKFRELISVLAERGPSISAALLRQLAEKVANRPIQSIPE
ncbi:hypothetical protein [Arenicella xantha]|uniref:Uncharacterized protein n=1 Tax=Arenicella xantha TaxID=644221 RepID=A0A395JPN7_9GAMM|nr:hypothetical protein [Arenicella xantha]RBP51767.1 hypothetical protein DFR28_1021200 [Arenicella xantha]